MKKVWDLQTVVVPLCSVKQVDICKRKREVKRKESNMTPLSIQSKVEKIEKSLKPFRIVRRSARSRNAMQRENVLV